MKKHRKRVQEKMRRLIREKPTYIEFFHSEVYYDLVNPSAMAIGILK